MIETGSAEQPLELFGVLGVDRTIAGEIRFTADFTVPKGRRLIIAPGSHIRVVGNDSSKINPEYLDKGTEILVQGRLLVMGSHDLPVSISLDEATPQGERWTGIELVGAEQASFSHLEILGAETGILSIDSSPRLSQVNILGSRYGVIFQGSGSLNYAGGRISGGDAGLLCFDDGQLKLSDLQLVDNQDEGLYLNRDCQINAQNLQIERNDLGIVALPKRRVPLAIFAQHNRVDFRPIPTEVLP